jgi:hypothetical protein
MPGNYVGVAHLVEEEDVDFAERMEFLHDEIVRLHEVADELTTGIRQAFESFII